METKKHVKSQKKKSEKSDVPKANTITDSKPEDSISLAKFSYDDKDQSLNVCIHTEVKTDKNKKRSRTSTKNSFILSRLKVPKKKSDKTKKNAFDSKSTFIQRALNKDNETSSVLNKETKFYTKNESQENIKMSESNGILIFDSEDLTQRRNSFEEEHVTFPITVNVPKSIYIEDNENNVISFDEWENMNIETPIHFIDYREYYIKPPQLIDRTSIMGITPTSSLGSFSSIHDSEINIMSTDNMDLNEKDLFAQWLKIEVDKTKRIFQKEFKSLIQELNIDDFPEENIDENYGEKNDSAELIMHKLRDDIHRCMIFLRKQLKRSLRKEKSLKLNSEKSTSSSRFRHLIDAVVHGIKIEKELIKLHDEAPKQWNITQLLVLKILGGSEGRYILLVRHDLTDYHYVLRVLPKIYYNTKEKINQMMKEKECYEICKHKYYLIQLYQAFETDLSFCFLLEYAIGSDLGFHLKKFGCLVLHEAQLILKQLFKAIDFLHQKKIIHRNIQLSSVLLFDESQVKLSDFGLCLFEISGKEICGNEEYRAPEIDGETEYSFEVDIWSFGVIAYKILVSGNSENLDKSDILKESKDNFSRLETMNRNMQNLLKKTLKINPKERIANNSLDYLLQMSKIFPVEEL